jgi:hypothetical protein
MRRALSLILISLLGTGCVGQPTFNRPAAIERRFATTQGLTQRIAWPAVEAQVDPPAGWIPQPLHRSPRHTHQIWLSPTGDTAYGVIRFELPVPVGPDIVLWYFMREMRKSQGDGVLLSKEPDPVFRGGILFVAEGGPYRIHTSLLTRGWRGWAIYCGTLRNHPINQEELDLAERAREYTVPGLQPASEKRE